MFICLSVCISFSQVAEDGWSTVMKEYESGRIPDTVYLNKVQALTERFYKDTGLKQKLETYRSIAWRHAAYQAYRPKYYAMLANNAVITHKEGASIYYLQKSEEELRKIKPYINSLSEPRLLLAIYGRDEKTNISRRKVIFENIFPYIQSLPHLSTTQKVPAATLINAMTILSNGARLYSNQNDTAFVFKILATSETISNSLKRRPPADVENTQQCAFMRYQIKYIAAQMEGNKVKVKKMLDTSLILITSLSLNPHTNQAWRRSAERALLRKFIDYYIIQHQPDSSRYYLHLLAQMNIKNDPGDGTAYLLYSSKVAVMDNHFKQAYTDLLRAYEINDSVINLKTTDINDNMYAQLMAEQTYKEVIQLKKQKQKRTIIFCVAALAGIGFIYLLVYRYRKKEKKSKRKIEELNKFTQIQIAEIETKANLIQRELSMELHDDIAGRLVYVCNFIQKEVLDEADEEKRERLERIGALARDAYKNIRNKSHEWYTEGLKKELVSFSESVQKLAEHALPEDWFDKEIAIDDSSLENVPYTIRIQLLRIIQESMVNILKHADASEVKIFIYKEDNTVVLQIKDNGRGFDNISIPRRKGIGLQSLRERVMDMKGSCEIISSKNGTEVMVTFPV